MMEKTLKKESKLFHIVQAIIDIALVNLGFYMAFILRFEKGGITGHIEPYIEIIPLISLTAIIFFYVYGVFKCGEKSYIETVYSTFLSLVFVIITSMALAYFNRGFHFPRSIFLIGFLLQFFYLCVWKYVSFKLYYVFHQPMRMAVICKDEKSEELLKKIIMTNGSRYIIKFITDSVDNIKDSMDEIDAICIGTDISSEEKAKIISYSANLNKTVYIIPELYEISLFNAKLTQFDDVPAFCIENLNLTIEQRISKRLFDIAISLIGIILSSPLMIMAYVSIRLYDRGPALFSQERVTRGNRKFKVHKFRSMIVDAEKKTGPVLATDRDPRITPMGRIYRATRIDELPQLFNVLRGDMSIVGPRPEREFFIEQFKEDIPDFEYRTSVKAGVTGLAQVLGKYTTTPEDKLRFDLLYIRNYSFISDLKIIFQTIKIMFMKASSQGVQEEKSIEEMLNKLNYEVYEEIGVTRMEKA
ncbi:MAG: sugar transferase [Anaeromicrobium sp.]|jgi:exopolysaccharide biosynthesis polyprenyl glycosylphosphotransferase|uniref:sugar transferase n=1 Tax=Anaeromicrobium sp. TaxID=1929132 RepID=UPI0025D48A8E|nr:sugar transferase [Anaeromicrobium sp.]MCT4593977.1 sugar transferase [Anaeromicrobium sp.]